jgi:hypothetical protein
MSAVTTVFVARDRPSLAVAKLYITLLGLMPIDMHMRGTRAEAWNKMLQLVVP